MSKNKTFLWLIPKWTLPATDGARVATDRLIKNMVKAGAIIDVMCLGNKDEKIDIGFMKRQWGVRNVFYKTRPLPQKKLGKLLFYLFKFMTHPKCPLTMSSFDAFTTKDFVKRIAAQNRYDYLFLDGLHLGAIFMHKGKFKKPEYVQKVVYRAHNLETEIWEKATKDTSNILKKILFRLQSQFVKNYEKSILEGSDLVAPISEEDNISIKALVPNINTHLTLMGMNFRHPLAYNDSDKIHFLFLGRFRLAT